MNFFKKISKSSAGQPTEDTFDSTGGKKSSVSKMADVEGKYTRSLDDLKEARNQIDNLQSALNDKERQLNQATSELERMKLADETKDLAGDQRLEQYKQALQQRDARINNLKAELENVTQKMNKELTALNQKMEFIMDEKDHQIKRLNALGGTETKKDGNVRTAISAETGRKIVGGKLPKIDKTEAEAEVISEALCGNTFMKSLAHDQRQKV
jgi:chromosome segregation ATPase